MIVRIRNSKTTKLITTCAFASTILTVAALIASTIAVLFAMTMLVPCLMALGLCFSCSCVFIAAACRWNDNINAATEQVSRHFGYEDDISSYDPFLRIEMDRTCSLPNAEGLVHVTNKRIASSPLWETRKVEIIPVPSR